MRRFIKNVFTVLGGKDFIILLTMTGTAYIFFERAGIFRQEHAGYREIFHSTPLKALSVAFLISALTGLIQVSFSRGFKNTLGSMIFFFSIIVIVASLWVSVYTRFEGRAWRAEGQTFNAFKWDYLPHTVYGLEERRLPQIGITVRTVSPETSPNGMEMKKVTADILYAGRTTKGILEGKLSSSFPLISDWTFVRITDFGYMVRYVLYDLQEKELESQLLFMKLFPPGAEEHFETMFLGYVFYVRCYPDYVENNGKPGSASTYTKNPVFNLRIVRNKDIVFNDLLKPAEKVRFDNAIISLPEVRMWVEIDFVRDLGLLVAAAGTVFLLLGVILMARKKDLH
jgi:hypothetical protein